MTEIEERWKEWTPFTGRHIARSERMEKQGFSFFFITTAEFNNTL
jgi:hypothetical protein